MNSKYYDQLVNTLLSLKNKKELEIFLDGILTDKERKEIPVRLQIVKLLKSGMSQREITEKLRVGIATVTRGSKEITKGNFESVKENSWQPLTLGG